MAGLERFRGHFYNWYDVETLAPLRPAYVSTVDSGNLAGHLLVLRIALLEASESPFLGPQLLEGARDAVRLALEDLVVEQAALPAEIDSQRLREALDSLGRLLELAETPTDLGEWWVLLERFSAPADQVEAAMNHSLELPEQGAGPPSPLTAAQRLAYSVADTVSAVREPLAMLAEYAPWARLIADVPAELRNKPALEPLTTRIPSLVGLAEGLGDALAALDAYADEDGPARAWAAEVADEYPRPAGRPRSSCSRG